MVVARDTCLPHVALLAGLRPREVESQCRYDSRLAAGNCVVSGLELWTTAWGWGWVGDMGVTVSLSKKAAA